MKKKVFKIKHTRFGINRTSEYVYEGTLDELIKSFSYTLECGHSWNRKIKIYPKNINSLIINLNKSYEEIEGGFTTSRVELF